MKLRELLDLLHRIPQEMHELDVMLEDSEDQSPWDLLAVVLPTGDSPNRYIELSSWEAPHGLGYWSPEGIWVRLAIGEDPPAEAPRPSGTPYLHFRPYADLPDPPEDDTFKLPDPM